MVELAMMRQRRNWGNGLEGVLCAGGNRALNRSWGRRTAAEVKTAVVKWGF